jgi:hypothetical protein
MRKASFAHFAAKESPVTAKFQGPQCGPEFGQGCGDRLAIVRGHASITTMFKFPKLTAADLAASGICGRRTAAPSRNVRATNRSSETKTANSP